MIVEPGRSSPRRSASANMWRAMRSFMLPPGFMNSAFAKILQRVRLLAAWSRISGVCPMESDTSEVTRQVGVWRGQ